MTRDREPVVGLPCEGCEQVFVGKPARLASATSLVPTGTAGQALEIVGVVRNARGDAVAGAIVYAYQTDADGLYPNSTPANRHGDYRGWVVSDQRGRYAIRTVRPGSYPVPNAPPQHIHMHVIEPGRCTYYIADIEFTDDPKFRPSDNKRGGAGVSTPRWRDNAWRVRRDIVLGANIPGYDACERSG